VKEKARFHQLQRHEQPGLVTIKVSELDERVRPSLRILLNSSDTIHTGKGTWHIRYGSVFAIESFRGEWIQIEGWRDREEI
jgi:hypothetical protein